MRGCSEGGHTTTLQSFLSDTYPISQPEAVYQYVVEKKKQESSMPVFNKYFCVTYSNYIYYALVHNQNRNCSDAEKLVPDETDREYF